MKYERVATCSDRIKAALNIKGMKQADLCRITNIPKSALSQYISGAFEPKQDRIYLLSKALNVSEAWLMGLDVPMERKDKTLDKNQSDELTDGEREWLDFYHKLSEESRCVMIEMMNSIDKIPQDKQQFALQVLKVTLDYKE